MSTFAATFRDLVMPDIRRACAIQGWMLAKGKVEFSAASATVQRIANTRGAYALPINLQDDLRDWIDTNILRFEAEATRGTDAWRNVDTRVLEQLMAHKSLWPAEAARGGQ